MNEFHDITKQAQALYRSSECENELYDASKPIAAMLLSELKEEDAEEFLVCQLLFVPTS